MRTLIPTVRQAMADPVLDGEELEDFLSRYRDRDRDHAAGARAPTLRDSLVSLQAAAGLPDALGRLPEHVQALIEGCAAPANAAALREFPAARGVPQVDIVAIDLYDLPTTYRRLGMTLPDMTFVQADACALAAVAADGAFDLGKLCK
jgi:hypothetical protein